MKNHQGVQEQRERRNEADAEKKEERGRKRTEAPDDEGRQGRPLLVPVQADGDRGYPLVIHDNDTDHEG